MKIKNLLVSQPAPASTEKSPFAEIEKKHNLSIDFHPFIRVEGCSVKEFRKQHIDVIAHTAVIFSSRTIIDNFFKMCDTVRITIPETMKYFCVTEAVALYLQKYIVYRKRKIFFGKGSFVDLAELIVKHAGEKFLLPLVEPHKAEVPKALDKLKIKYSKLIIAHTVSNELEHIDTTKYDLMAFYSPAEIAALSSLETDNNGAKPLIATFGNGTALAAQNAGFAVSVLAPTPECPSMITALDAFIKKYNSNEQIEAVKIEKRDSVASILKAVQPKAVKRTTVRKPTATAVAKTSATKSQRTGSKPTTDKNTK